MVKTLLLISLLAGGLADAASLTARLDRSSVALGEPVSLTLQAQGLSLEALDVAPLGANFEVFGRTLSRGTGSEILVLTLYPRAVGRVQIPPLHVESSRTAALPLAVTDGSETMPSVTSSWSLEPAQPQVNQPLRLTLAICDDGSLQWQRPVLPTHSGRIVRSLGENEGEGERAGAPCTLRRYHWALLATQAGAAELAVPMLDASRFGQRLRFPAPTLAYRAAALPAWLPAHVAPSAPVVVGAPLPARWALQRPLGWRFEVTGGYSADSLKALLDLQLRDTPALGVYPPLIEPMTSADPNSPLARHAVTLFLQPRASGVLNLPTLRFPWYDAAQGRMASVTLAGTALTVLDPRWQRARQIAGGLAGALLLAVIIWQGHRMARWRLARRRGLRAIRQARSVDELAQAVRRFSLTREACAPSLGEWLRHMRRETGACDVSDAVRQLEQHLYGQAALTLDALQQAFVRALARARPNPRLR